MKNKILLIICIMLIIIVGIIFLYFIFEKRVPTDNKDNIANIIENTTSTQKINNTNKIEIIEENNNDINNTIVKIREFSVDKIIFRVTDANEISSQYSVNYELYEYNENTNKAKENYIKEATNSSTSLYSGPNIEYEYNKVSENYKNIKSDTIKRKIINSLDIYTEEIEIDFKQIYTLLDGKYYIVIFYPDFNIRIDFNINNNNVDYKEPYINNYTEPNTTYFEETLNH